MTTNKAETFLHRICEPIVVVGLDVDNTLADADGLAYRQTTAEFLALVDIGLNPGERFRAYEEIRACGDALDRIGLGNPLHDRNHPDALGVLCLTSCAHRDLRRDLAIDSGNQSMYKEFLLELGNLHGRTKRGSQEARLAGEMEFRKFCEADTRVAQFRTEVRRVAQNPRIANWARYYESLVRDNPIGNDCLPLNGLVSRGAIPIIITEGRSDVQTNKLAGLGLNDSFQDRVLISEAAACVPGTKELAEAISHRIDDRIQAATDRPDPELLFLWCYNCLIEEWAGKTPSFFARCLHAIQQSPDAPQTAIQPPVYVRKKDWQPLKFVMIGDRYDKDVEPLIDLLGPGVGMKIRLRMGKYGHLHPEDSLVRDRRPDRTFTDWDSLAHFLTEELTPEQVPPITTPPDIADRRYITRELIEFGLQCELEAVRTVAAAFEAQMSDRA